MEGQDVEIKPAQRIPPEPGVGTVIRFRKAVGNPADPLIRTYVAIHGTTRDWHLSGTQYPQDWLTLNKLIGDSPLEIAETWRVETNRGY